MTRRRTIGLGIIAAGLSLVTPALDARASGINLAGNVASYTSPDIWEVKCLGSTQDLAIRTVATTGSSDKFVAIAMALTPKPLYGHAVASEVFSPGGVGSDVLLDRPGQGMMKLLVTVKQTGGNPGDTYKMRYPDPAAPDPLPLVTGSLSGVSVLR